MIDLTSIEDPQFLKGLTPTQLTQLSTEIRRFLIEKVSKTGGYLSSNLGVVELTLALHFLFDFSEDRLIFDIGHQSYVHKILTGRAKYFDSLRKFNGLSSYPDPEESEYDAWNSGHAGSALSFALGMAIARDLRGQGHHVVALVGDASITSGVSYEALNHIGKSSNKVIAVLNDNSSALNKQVNAITRGIAKARNSNSYTAIKADVKQVLNKNLVGKSVLKGMKAVKDSIKKTVIDERFFQELGIEYLGPIDGHNFNELINAFETARKHDGSVLVHVVTTKGKGFRASEDRSGRWHGAIQFDPDSGDHIGDLPLNHLSWAEIYAETLNQLAKLDSRIMVLSAGSQKESKLEKFFALYPQRSIDCAASEEHMMSLAASLSMSGMKPFVSICSALMQRSYDQLNHDIARLNLPLVIGIDRAGLMPEDGSSHHGVFDISFLRPLPNFILAEAKDAQEAQNLLYTAFRTDAPFAIRYPRGSASYKALDKYEMIEVGSWTLSGKLEETELFVLSYGPDVDKIIDKAKANQLNITVVNARFIKPLDVGLLEKLAKLNKPILVYESDMLTSGLGSAVLEWANDNKFQLDLHRIGIQDHYVSQGSMPELRKHEQIDLGSLFKKIMKLIDLG